MVFTYEIYDNASQNEFIDFREKLPNEITQNLKFPLRPYQKEAL